MRASRAQISAAEQPILQQIQAERAANLKKAQQQMGFAKAASALLTGIAPRVQDTYSNAANADAGYARGLGDNVQADISQRADANNAFLSKMGTPSAGLEHPADVGGTAYGLKGYIPATTLQREGAAFGSAAQMLPAQALRQGQQQASATLNDTTNIGKLHDELARLAATQPAVYQQLLSTLSEMQYRKAELGLSAGRLNLAQQSLASENAYRQAELGQSQQRINNEQAYHIAEMSLRRNSMKQAWARIGISEKNLQLRAAAAEAKLKGGGLTPDKIISLKQYAAGAAKAMHDGIPKTNTKAAVPAIPSYKAAFKQMILHGVPPSIAIMELKGAGYSVPIKGDGTGMFKGLDKMVQKGLAATASTALNSGVHAGKGGMGVGPAGAQNVYGTAYGHAGGFLPRGASFVLNRKDQGRDIQTRPGTPIIAPGDGYVVRIASDPGGGGAHFGPSYPVVFFTSGPYKGHYVYIGHTVAVLRAGQHFKAGMALSRTQRSGRLNGGAPDGWAEIGFAPGGSPGSFGQAVPF